MVKKMQFSISSKLMLFIVLLVVLTAVAVNAVYFSGTEQILTDRAVGDMERDATYLMEPLERSVENMKTDVQTLSELPPIQGIARAQQHGGIDPEDKSTQAAWLDRLAIIFGSLMKTHPAYTQIRYIGVKNDGKELLRLDRVGSSIQRVPQARLQSKGDRSYFQEATKLNADNLYLSRMELNREFDKIALPYDLVMRAAVPIYAEESNKLFGIVIINASYNKLFQQIADRAGKQSDILYITNDIGDYLYNPDASKLYASDLGNDKRVQNDFPKLFENLTHKGTVQQTLLPSSKEGRVRSFVKYYYDTLNPDRYLALTLQAPYSAIMAKIKGVRQQSYLAAAGIAIVAIIIAALFLRFLLLPLNAIAYAVEGYRNGKANIKDMDLPVDSPDEIGVLAKEFIEMIEAKNNEDWIKGNLAEISKSLLGFNNLTDFADNLMELLTPLVRAQVGVLYIDASYMQKNQMVEEGLNLSGAYGYDGDRTVARSIHIGEGIIGQCAKEQKEKLISGVAEDNLRIVSALTDSKPRDVFILPVVFKNNLVGVMELASLEHFSQTQLTFLRQIAFNVGVIVHSISTSMRTEELLEETQAAAEELKRNEEELKAQQEELQASNEELEEKNEKVQLQAEELEEGRDLIAGKMEELERANQYKSEFLANISHELRTPLNSLLILAKSLADNEDGNLTSEQIEEASVIYNGGLDLLHLINDILDLSKVEAGKISMSVDEVTIDEVVGDLKRQFAPVVSDSGVQFKVSVDKNVPEAIRTDSQRLEQVLKNLLSNAFKFTEKGMVSLSIGKADSDLKFTQEGLTAANAIVFKVVDTGIGIAGSKLKEIFEAFQQEDGSTSRHYGGTGLGLTISRKFAQLLGGEIQVASEKGKGSTFILCVPERLPEGRFEADMVNDETVNSNPVQRLPLSSVSGAVEKNQKTVLIIEGDKDFAEQLAKQARERGYDVVIASTGKAGLLKASEQQADAIILDAQLADIDGRTILEQLKSNAALRNIPVHMITASADNDNEMKKHGAVGCLTKPFNQEDMERMFAEIESRSGGKPIKEVLVIEDDSKTQAAIKKLLQKKELELTFVTTGKQAFNRIKKQHFDCVILDLSLPDISGFDWLEKLKEMQDTAFVPPVVIYTAKELSEAENKRLRQYTESIVIKGGHSSERLLDEVTLFLHSIDPSAADKPSQQTKMRHDPDELFQGKKILLTDDDLRNTFALSRMLKKQGMEVVIGDNGQMALEKLKEESDIALVIMDIMMPVMDGYKAIEEIRKEEQWKNLPIIALTARAMPEEQDKCMEAGANDYMTKPVDIEKLLTLMRLWLFQQQKVA